MGVRNKNKHNYRTDVDLLFMKPGELFRASHVGLLTFHGTEGLSNSGYVYVEDGDILMYLDAHVQSNHGGSWPHDQTHLVCVRFLYGEKVCQAIMSSLRTRYYVSLAKLEYKEPPMYDRLILDSVETFKKHFVPLTENG